MTQGSPWHLRKPQGESVWVIVPAPGTTAQPVLIAVVTAPRIPTLYASRSVISVVLNTDDGKLPKDRQPPRRPTGGNRRSSTAARATRNTTPATAVAAAPL
jgi:hypothetical protein